MATRWRLQNATTDTITTKVEMAITTTAVAERAIIPATVEPKRKASMNALFPVS
jgi:hypothetical protein